MNVLDLPQHMNFVIFDSDPMPRLYSRFTHFEMPPKAALSGNQANLCNRFNGPLQPAVKLKWKL